MDEVDHAARQNDWHLAQAIRNHKHAKRSKVKATGHCLYCDEALGNPMQRWCDAMCRDGWQRYDDAKRRTRKT